MTTYPSDNISITEIMSQTAAPSSTMATETIQNTNTLAKSMSDSEGMSRTAAPNSTGSINALNTFITPSDLNHTLNQQSSRPPTEFHRFTELPSELRLKIYDQMMPGPRIICVMWRSKRKFYTDSQVPVILWISVESRKYALKKYSQLVFENQMAPFNYYQPSPFGAYIDYTRDIIYLHDHGTVDSSDPPSFLEMIGVDASSRIRHLAFLNVMLLYARFTRVPPVCNISRLTSIQSISIVLCEELHRPISRDSLYLKEIDCSDCMGGIHLPIINVAKGDCLKSKTLEHALRCQGMPENILQGL